MKIRWAHLHPPPMEWLNGSIWDWIPDDCEASHCQMAPDGIAKYIRSTATNSPSARSDCVSLACWLWAMDGTQTAWGDRSAPAVRPWCPVYSKPDTRKCPDPYLALVWFAERASSESDIGFRWCSGHWFVGRIDHGWRLEIRCGTSGHLQLADCLQCTPDSHAEQSSSERYSWWLWSLVRLRLCFKWAILFASLNSSTYIVRPR